jgi:hypothetical protein
MSPWKGAKFTGDNFEQGADGAFNVSAPEVFYCDISYVLDLYKEPRTAPNRRLDIAELRSKEGIPPSFLFRWDEKDNQLDVDIQGVSRTVKHCFKHGIRGYAGHRPQQVQSDGHVFEVDVRIPKKHIFHGYVKFNINHMAKAAVSIGSKVSIGYVVSKIKSVAKRKPN